MANIFDQLFGAGSKPYRRDARLRMTYDTDGNPVIDSVSGESVNLSSNGSIDRVQIAADLFYHCGCPTETTIGGQCAECRRVSCLKCFGRCANCSKPLCLEHSRIIEQEGAGVRLCRGCHDSLNRKRIVRAVAGAILKPFVREEGKP